MYSAARSHSSIVPERPRFSITGMRVRPTALRSEKFCMLRVPICSTSANSATMSTCAGSITSVMMGRPVRSRASASRRSPSRPSPWKAYGEVRGLNAPPRRSVAPASATPCATSKSWSRDSIEQGPAISVSEPPPITASRTLTTVGVSRNSREARRYGRVARFALATPGRAANSCSSVALTPDGPRIARVDPVAPCSS